MKDFFNKTWVKITGKNHIMGFYRNRFNCSSYRWNKG